MISPEEYRAGERQANRSDAHGDVRGSGWSMLEQYAEDERRRVDGIKAELEQGYFASEVGGLSYTEQMERVSEPKFWRKLGRVALDAIDVHPKASEKRRQQEALAIAEKEIEMERMEQEFQRQMNDMRFQTSYDVQQVMREEAQEKHDQEKLAREMSDSMDVQRHYQQERYRTERRQEFLERSLNEKLVTVDEVEAQFEANNPEVGKRYLEYGEKEIPVYDLKGLPFAMLSHSIEYRKADYDNNDHMGVQTSKQLVDNPAIWKQRNDEFEMVDSGGQARGDVISTSYINSEHNINTRLYETNHEPDICYGFGHVEGDAILVSMAGDMGSSNNFGKMRGATRNLADLKMLEAMPAGYDGYNEIVLRRYDETGKPRLPDYIIAQNGKITEGMLRHAAEFNVPIMNIEEKFYNEKFRERAEEILANVNESDDYTKVVSALHEIGSFGPYRAVMAHINQATLDQNLGVMQEVLQKDYPEGLNHKLLLLGELELKKRIPFIAQTLKNEIENMRTATEQGEDYDGRVDGLDDFYAKEFDGRGYVEPERARHLVCNMRLKGDAVNIATNIYKDDGMGGKAYELLAPLVEEYGRVRQENTQRINNHH